ncbi:exodeoxyribonuclease V subunit beta [Enterobacteriaceae endosymbiont of Donacia cincticornis]|uniref:exodeoxyribonuclease V subunit beta n=1 Tax=Enterobacteriaceae endosymbiont of Donacia cincticornis TaxID=2675773 RepID=UPI001449FB8F|nr:exodeoxyribonuclease V subunit beta [Enterobacteriaceae endosymbiont of Donacia cincticornis]QJC36270.1 exodeoxyribonuclease V subunit beta [Enterobacteriaceae endosymbiont of Donacia cincticornis]
MINKLINFKEFNPFKENLEGQFLIEASAGTGKTFNIIIIYLRMLLGLHQKKNNIKPLNVEQILVVTFTDMATQNLYKKIKNSIYLLKNGCIQQKSKYDVINNIIKEIKDYKTANNLLLKAEKNIDHASIYTIHSFCQKILNLKNYEIYDFLFNKKIISNELILQKKASVIFWKIYLYDLPKEIIKIILLFWKTPDDLLKTLLPFLSQQKLPIIKYPFKNRNICVQFDKNKKYIRKIKKYWIKYKNNIISIISNSNVNKHIYNKKFLKNWINIINKWSLIKTKNYFFPKELLRFSQKILIKNTTKNSNTPIYVLFKYIDIFINKIVNLKYLIIIKAIKYIKNYILKQKKKNNEISFNDLLNILNKSLNTRFGIQIIKNIRKLFPVVLIDEFQDTDIQQYNILKKIYFNQKNNLMILIGDPKQAIYSFRGADIFTYLKASLEIKKCYTLTYNWRSSSTMIDSINKLFSNRTYPFLFKNIVFNPIKYTCKKLNDHFVVNNKIKSGITFWFIDKIMDIDSYRKKISYICAYEICQLIILGKKGKAFLQKNNRKKKINISDITVIVRNKFEAIILQKEFKKFNLPFIYLSNSNHIFETQEAKELVFLLKTILKPNEKQKIINTLSSTLFNIDLSFFSKKKYIEKIINRFNKYKLIWEKYGILSMLEEIFVQDKFISEINIPNELMEEKIKNILYLGEIIQTSCSDIIDNKQIITWLLEQIKYKNKNLLNQQIKLNNENNKIKIMTIHKSKGLQFPIVWLPFISSNIIEFVNKNGIIYHNRKNFEITLDFIQDEESKKLFLEETLSENLRLLYVSLTRSIFHCSIGITNLKFYNFKKKNLYLSYINALNFLLKKKNDISDNNFKKILYNLKDKNISIKIFNKKKKIKLDNNIFLKLKNKKLFTFPIKNFFYKNKIVSSFSKIKKQQNFYLNYLNINYQYNFLNFIKNKKKTQYNFPIGKNIGIIIHKILEKLDFTKKISRSFIKKELIEKNIDSNWHIMITNWFNHMLNIPIGKNKIILHQINNHEKKTEFKFCLSIKKNFSSIKYNNIINKYDIISSKLSKLKFETISGFLSGIIDLIFLWKNKFYIIDYKSNWLGYNSKDYEKNNLEKDICLNRYDIQYHFYTLALHKYLKYRIKDYNYSKCFGGIIYLYIRGLNQEIKKYNGVWETKPSSNLINKLNNLFL